MRKMKREITSFVGRLRRDEGGAVFILVAIGMVAFLGLGALAIDVSRIVYAQRTLQATTDLAAQAGATEIFNGSGVSATTTATSYSAKSGSYNFQKGLNVTSATATLEALNGNPAGGCPSSVTPNPNFPYCAATGPNAGSNAVLVTQTAKVSLTLGEIFKIGSVTLTAKSLALGKGSAMPPLNIMLIIDNTGSMTSMEPGATCGTISNPTKIECALAGAQTLLSELWPNQDQVGLMVFPGVDPTAADTANGLSSVANDGTCSSSVKSPCIATCNSSTGKCSCSNGSPSDILIVPYNASPQYQLVTPTNSGGGSSNSFCGVSQGSCGTSTAMSLASPIVSATCQPGITTGQTACGTGSSGCAGEQVAGGQGTYFADAINQAQATLVATNQTGICANLTCQNVIILLSDGGAGNAGDSEGGNAVTSVQSLAGITTLTFASVPSYVVAGSTVADNTTANKLAIPANTTVVSATETTVTLSGPVTDLGNPVATGATTTTLTFASLPTGLAAGASVADSTTTTAIPAGTTVKSISGKTVTLSNTITAKVNDVIAFGFVGQGDNIAFSSNNQCNAAITAAHNAAKAGTWVYAVAYGSGLGDAQADTVANTSDFSSCSDTESPKVNSCYTMYQIASSPDVINDPSKFYSDPMVANPTSTKNCISPANPTVTSVPAIFADIGYSFQHTSMLVCGTAQAGGAC
jgi:Flp pilus assembly protein TadG